jgi:hypothetical protein
MLRVLPASRKTRLTVVTVMPKSKARVASRRFASRPEPPACPPLTTSTDPVLDEDPLRN